MIWVSIPSHLTFAIIILFKQVGVLSKSPMRLPMAVMRLLRLAGPIFVASLLHLTFLFSSFLILLFCNRPKEELMVPRFKPLNSRSNTWWIRPQDHGVLWVYVCFYIIRRICGHSYQKNLGFDAHKICSKLITKLEFCCILDFLILRWLFCIF